MQRQSWPTSWLMTDERLGDTLGSAIARAAAAGAGERDALILETLLAFKRAGATGVLSYHAVDAARLIG